MEIKQKKSQLYERIVYFNHGLPTMEAKQKNSFSNMGYITPPNS